MLTRLKMTNTSIIILLFIYSLLISVYSQNYTTTSQRTNFLSSSCTNIKRQNLLKFTPSPLPYLQSSFGFSSQEIVLAFIHGSSQQGLQKTKQGITAGLVIFWLPWVICGIILILIWPFLLCCCFCHCCCFCCKPKQKDSANQPGTKKNNQTYQQCQMKWPVATLIILMLIIVAAGIFGLIRIAGQAYPSFKNIQCSSAIFVDDLKNGNVTKNGLNFFAGIETIDSFTSQLITTLNNSYNNLTTLAIPGLNNLPAQLSSLKADVQNIPNGSGGALVLNYNTPLDSSTSSGSISSTFPGILGTAGASSTLIGDTINTIDVISGAGPATASDAQNYANQLIGVVPDLQTLKNNTSQSVKQVNQLNQDLKITYKSGQDAVNYISLGLYIKFGAIIFIATLIIVGSLCIGCRKAYNCRYFMYFLCFFIWFATLLTCIIAIAMSVAVPASVVGCSFAEIALSNQTTFNHTFSGVLGGQTVAQLGSCIPSGDGLYFKNKINQSIINKISNAQNNLTDLKSFYFSSYSATLSNDFNILTDGINNALKTYVVDISNSASIAILQKLSDSSNYLACANSVTSFAYDSWIPSLNQSIVSCKISSASNSDSSTCQNTADFQIRASGCTGCMDQTSFQQLLNTNTAGMVTHFQNRYNNVNCNSFANDISNVWTNYFKKKRTQLTPVQARRSSTQSGNYATVNNNFNMNINPAFKNVITDLDFILPKFTDNTTGIITGLDCRVLGEDVVLVKDIACQQTIVTTYTLLIIQGVITIAFLIGLCCIVCVGVRSARQSPQKDQAYIDYQGAPEPYYNPPSDQIQIKNHPYFP